jgi:hypothetical protein
MFESLGGPPRPEIRTGSGSDRPETQRRSLALLGRVQMFFSATRPGANVESLTGSGSDRPETQRRSLALLGPVQMLSLWPVATAPGSDGERLPKRGHLPLKRGTLCPST